MHKSFFSNRLNTLWNGYCPHKAPVVSKSTLANHSHIFGNNKLPHQIAAAKAIFTQYDNIFGEVQLAAKSAVSERRRPNCSNAIVQRKRSVEMRILEGSSTNISERLRYLQITGKAASAKGCVPQLCQMTWQSKRTVKT